MAPAGVFVPLWALALVYPFVLQVQGFVMLIYPFVVQVRGSVMLIYPFIVQVQGFVMLIYPFVVQVRGFVMLIYPFVVQVRGFVMLIYCIGSRFGHAHLSIYLLYRFERTLGKWLSIQMIQQTAYSYRHNMC